MGKRNVLNSYTASVISIFVFIQLLQTVACKKDHEGEYYINGRVTDLYSGAGVKGVRVSLIKNYYNSLTSYSSTKSFASDITDENGDYKMEWLYENGGFDITCSKANYITNTTQYIVDNTAITLNFSLVPYGFTRIHVKNINPYNIYDEVSINQYSSTPHSITYYGSNIDRELITPMNSNESDHIVYTVKKNNITTTRDTTVFINPADTIAFDFYF